MIKKKMCENSDKDNESKRPDLVFCGDAGEEEFEITVISVA